MGSKGGEGVKGDGLSECICVLRCSRRVSSSEGNWKLGFRFLEQGGKS